MNAPSRNMPPAAAPQKATIGGWIALGVFVGGLIWGMVVSLPLRWALGGSFMLTVVLTAIHRFRLKRIREERMEESLCTFARALPAKHHDTWIVRAVYEEVSHYVQAPLRPSDSVVKFWGIDGDDLDDAIVRIAHRAGRSLDGVEKNPLRGKVTTVSDMITFLELQPKRPNQSPEPTPGPVTPRAK